MGNMPIQREHPNAAKIRELVRPIMEQPRSATSAALREGWDTLYRIRDCPSFGAETVWDIALNSADPTRLSIFEILWDRNSDMRRFYEPLYGLSHKLKLRAVPSLSWRHVISSTKDIELFNANWIPRISRDAIVIDGNYTYVEAFIDGEMTAEHRWENSMPEEGSEELVAWKETSVQRFAELLVDAVRSEIEF